MIATLQVNADRMALALDDAMLATDLADYLVRKGVPFRESHGLVGQVVRRGEEQGLSLKELALGEYRRSILLSARTFSSPWEAERSRGSSVGSQRRCADRGQLLRNRRKRCKRTSSVANR